MSNHATSPLRASAPVDVPTNATRTKTGSLPREVLTWLQSLSLSSVVKNPRRDLANGYVIAQICAHYWAQVPLHSFSNGASTASKQSNWYVLQKVLRKHDIEVSAAMTEGMIEGRGDCAMAFLKQLYTIFTGKAIEEVSLPLAEPLEEVPSKDVPVLTPSTAVNAAVRARQAAENAPLAGLSSSSSSLRPPHISAVTPPLRLNTIKKEERVLSFGAFDGASDAFFRGSTNSRTGGFNEPTSGATPASRVATKLPPIVPPQPKQAAFSNDAVALGKPALAVSVRPAGQVSTVLPTQPESPVGAANGATAFSPAATMTKQKSGEQTYPRDTSLATSWFCSKVRDALPAEVLEAFASQNNSAVEPLSPLAFTLAWLSAQDGVFEADLVYSGEGDERIREGQAVMRQRVWQSLLSGIHELAELVVHCAVHGLDIVVDSLFAAVHSTAVCDKAGKEVRPGVVFVRNALQLCTSLLAQVSSVDCHGAMRCFQAYFVASDAFAEAVRQVKWCVARDYARLIVTVLPPNRGLAAGVLESLWSTVEDIVRDAAAEDEFQDEDESKDATISPSTQSEVSLLTLLRALVETLLPYHTGAAVTHLRSLSPSFAAAAAATNTNATTSYAGPSTSDGTRTPSATAQSASQRVRGIYAGAAVAAEEDAFGNCVVRMAHQRCMDVFRRLGQQHHPTPFLPREVVLAETAMALAVDLLRVELASSFVAECVCGEPFLDVFYVLFPSVKGHGSAIDDETEGSQQLWWWLEHPTLSVLRARWLRWCLQRRWQYGLPCSPITTSLWKPSQRGSPSLGGSTGVLSDAETAVAFSREKGPWAGSDEMRAIHDGLRTVCAELLTMLDTEKENEEHNTRRRQKAIVLAACAMAESLPFLPSQYKTTVMEDTRDAVGGIEKTGATPDDVLRPVYAEAVAEAVMHVFISETTPAQMHALLHANPQTLYRLNEAAIGKEAAEEGAAAVTLTHPFVGLLAPYGPLVLRSEPLLLVNATLCVLDSVNAAAGKATTTAEKDVAAVARRLGARAAIVAREAQVEESIATRISWMHALLVEGRRLPQATTTTSAAPTTGTASSSSSPAPAAAADASAPSLLTSPVTEALAHRSQAVLYDEVTVSQWHNVILECWDTFMMVLQAATLRLRQRGGASVTTGPADAVGLSDALGESLLTSAQQAQEVVCCLEHELAAALPGHVGAAAASTGTAATTTAQPGRGDSVTLNSALLSGPMASFVFGATAETLQAAVGWMWAVVGGS